MKTTDLIPIVLYQLKDGDKYGLELVDAIKQVSNDKIEIKQPTLYPLLKKLEKSKFISSYWQDSEIGGKRHYYKITDNGLAQLDTFPSLEELIASALEEDSSSNVSTDLVRNEPSAEDVNNKATDENPANPPLSPSFSPFDALFKEDKEEPLTEENKVDNTVFVAEINEEIDNKVEKVDESVIASEIEQNSENKDSYKEDTKEDVSPILSTTDTETKSFDIFDALPYEEETETNKEFALKNPFEKETKDNLEQKTTLEINEDNAKLLSENAKEEEFLNEKSVTRFTEKPIIPAKETARPIENFEINVFDNSPTIQTNSVNIDIEYRDYIDYKTNPQVLESKKRAKLQLAKIALSSALALVVLSVLLAITLKNKISPLYCVVYVISTVFIVLYLCKFIGGYKSLKTQCQTKQYDYKKQIIIRTITLVSVFIVLLIANLIGLKEGNLISLSNFGNFLAPIIVVLYGFIDYLLAYVFYKLLMK